MKLKSIYILSSLFFLLTGCGIISPKYEPIVANSADPTWDSNFTNEEILKLYKETKNKNETISEHLYLEMDGEFKGKELFILSHKNKDTFFRVFSYDKENNEFQKLFETKSYYDKEKPYFIQGVTPFYANETEHVLIGQNINPNMYFYYLLIGKIPTSNKVDILIDNALHDDAEGAYIGEAQIGEQGISITENGNIFEIYYQTDYGYDPFKDRLK